MKLLSAAQIRKWDEYTVKTRGIDSWQLMEKAAKVFLNELLRTFGYSRPLLIVCGTGNNGGDALAVARLALEAGLEISVFIKEGRGTADREKNLGLLIHHTKWQNSYLNTELTAKQ